MANQDSMKLYYTPKVTLIARTEFLGAPENYDWVSDSETPAQALSEMAGRLCYMSFNKTTRKNHEYLQHIMESRHGSVLEHPSWTFLIEGVSRSYTHEQVRHRAGFAYSQLSQRYVDESEAAFVIPPLFADSPEIVDRLIAAFTFCQQEYIWLVEQAQLKLSHIKDKTERRKAARQAARCILPNATETKITITANARAWRHFIEMRANPAADREIRAVAIEILKILQVEANNIFGDFVIAKHETDGSEIATSKYQKV